MKLSRRDSIVGGVVALFVPKPPASVVLAAKVKAELAALRASLDKMVEQFNKHMHVVTWPKGHKVPGVRTG